MIHFQSSEDGATLRATEVKPKLDRFLLVQLGGEMKLRENHKEWFLSDRHAALKYKLQILAPENEVPQIAVPHKLYFGNIAIDQANPRFRRTIFYKGLIILKVICFDSELQNEIDEHIKAFFLIHNFGTRQTKGFGSFMVVNANARCDYIPLDLLKKFKPSFIYALTNGNNVSSMNLAKTLWDLLKGGINFTSSIRWNAAHVNKFKIVTIGAEHAYEKSFLVRKYANANTGSEKARIKASGILNRRAIALEDQVHRQQNAHIYDNYLFLRALLGLTDTYRFIDFDLEDTVTVEGTEKETINGHQVSKIQRFTAPVTIKIFNGHIVFLPGEIEDMLNQEFTFRSAQTLKDFTLRTPKQFDLPKLLREFADDFNCNKVNFTDKHHTDFTNVAALTLLIRGCD